MKKIKIGLLSKERGNYKIQEKFAGKENVIDETAKEVAHHKNALEQAGFEVEVIPWNNRFIHNIKSANVQMFFNVSSLIEASTLEEIGAPYVGSDTRGIILAADKSLAKRLWQQAKLPTSEFVVLRNMKDCQTFISNPPFPYPLFIKPVAGRGSAGINSKSVIHNSKELLRGFEKLINSIGQPVLVERFLKGREITIGLIGNQTNVKTLPPLEIKYANDAKFLTFNKKEEDSDQFICPADLSEEELNTVQKIGRRAFQTLGLRDFARVDIKLTPQGFKLLEINSFAGLMCTPKEKPHSYMGFMARAKNWGGKELIQTIVSIALERINHQ